MQKKDPVGLLIEAGLGASNDRDIRITAVTAYEMTGGAVAPIDRRKRERRDPVPAFHLLQDLVEYLGLWRGLILPYEAAADRIYRGFPAHPRQELKDDARIAAIAPRRMQRSGPATRATMRRCPAWSSSGPRRPRGSVDAVL